jgi:hypothetical protein
MLINGDDLVAETRDPSRWFSTLPSLGLSPEPDKSGYSSRRCEINSTPFLIRKGNLADVPVARTRTHLPPPRIPVSVGREVEEFVRPFRGQAKVCASKVFLATRYNLVRSFVSGGGTLSSCGFRSYHLPFLQSAGLIQMADRLSKVVPGKALMPGSLVESSESVAFHGELPATLKSLSHMQTWGDSVGHEVEPNKAAFQASVGLCPSDPYRLVKIWWRLFRESGIEPTRQPTFRLFGGMFPSRRRRVLRYGELQSKKVFVARLLPDSGPIHRARLNVKLLSRANPLDRWGILRALR